jgi:hypothetical protein
MISQYLWSDDDDTKELSESSQQQQQQQQSTGEHSTAQESRVQHSTVADITAQHSDRAYAAQLYLAPPHHRRELARVRTLAGSPKPTMLMQ